MTEMTARERYLAEVREITGCGEGPLSDEEVALCASLLKRARAVPHMEYPIIKAIWAARLMPMSPVECVIVDDMDKPGMVLLARRKPDDPCKSFADMWHHPGKYFPANATFHEAVQWVCTNEVGVRAARYALAGVCNFPRLGRDHELSLIVVCEPEREPVSQKNVLEWFWLGKLPDDLLPHHRLIQEHANRWLHAPHSRPQLMTESMTDN